MTDLSVSSVKLVYLLKSRLEINRIPTLDMFVYKTTPHTHLLMEVRLPPLIKLLDVDGKMIGNGRYMWGFSAPYTLQ